MKEPLDPRTSCGCKPQPTGILASPEAASPCMSEAPTCCGPPPEPRSGEDERPGYALMRFTESFLETPAGPAPRVKTKLDALDLVRHLAARLGFARNEHKVAPGLYATGDPGRESPVLVTANYRLSFDALRKELGGLDTWILVLDSRGVNVWCAAGKHTFSTEEVVLQVKRTGLDKVVTRKTLILPQLGATGVRAREVKKQCGFQVVWGPVRAGDLPDFLRQGQKAAAEMRAVDFPLVERAVLVPVEVSMILRPSLAILAAAFVLSGIGPGIFSLSAALGGLRIFFWALLAAVLAGAVATPVLLPWLPGPAFSKKGAVAGAAGAAVFAVWSRGAAGISGTFALALFIVAMSSFLAMNFTGATPFTSPSGVEKEMRKAIPFQAGGVVAAIALWIIRAFV